MTISERTRASFPLVAGVVSIVCAIGWTVGFVLYVDRRFSSLENAREQTAKEIAQLRTERDADSAKLDRLMNTLNDVKTSVAVIEERTRK